MPAQAQDLVTAMTGPVARGRRLVGRVSAVVVIIVIIINNNNNDNNIIININIFIIIIENSYLVSLHNTSAIS